MRISTSLLPTTSVRVIAEDMRYSRAIVLKDKFGQEYETKQHPIIYEAVWKNTLTDVGRVNALYNTFDFTGVTPFTVIAGGAGSGNSNPTDPTQLRLATELIGDTTRKTLTNTSDDIPFVAGDVEDEISGLNRKLLDIKFVYEEDDPNNGETFYEYAMFDTLTLPGTPTTQSGNMFARFVAANGYTKDSFSRISVVWSFRA